MNTIFESLIFQLYNLVLPHWNIFTESLSKSKIITFEELVEFHLPINIFSEVFLEQPIENISIIEELVPQKIDKNEGIKLLLSYHEKLPDNRGSLFS